MSLAFGGGRKIGVRRFYKHWYDQAAIPIWFAGLLGRLHEPILTVPSAYVQGAGTMGMCSWHRHHGPMLKRLCMAEV